MYSPTEEEFLKLAEKGNLIAVYRDIGGDLETPVSAFLKLSSQDEYGYLLESVEGQEKIARFSFIGCAPSAILRINGRKFEILTKSASGDFRPSKTILSDNPFLAIKNFMSAYKLAEVKDNLRFCGGLVGYIGYDMVRFIEDIPDKNIDTRGIPDSLFLLSGTLLIFDHFNHSLKVISCAFLKDKDKKNAKLAYQKSIARIEDIINKLQRPVKKSKVVRKKQTQLKFYTAKGEFIDMVKKAKEYIKKGDIIQVVLSQALSMGADFKPFEIYRRLRSLNPCAYMFYLKFKSLHLVGSSPEMLVRCEDGIVTTRPIAGTRPRGASKTEDKKLEKELLNDKKERAEHIMLLDLGRNDLGRVCRFGSVKVSEFMHIERYSHVMHIVSEIKGRLKEGKDIYDCLQAAFPAGTVSGSPKVRAMEIIDELESYRRGPYAGAVGYFGFGGNLDTCITIRTIVINKKTAYIQAGAGIVADSIAEKEYQETLNKAKAQIEALK